MTLSQLCTHKGHTSPWFLLSAPRTGQRSLRSDIPFPTALTVEDLSSKQQTQPWPQMPPLALGADTSRDVSSTGIKPEMGTSPGWDCSQHSRTPTQKYAAITLFIDPTSLHLVETNKKPHHRKPQTAFPASILPERRAVLRLPPACYCFTRCLLTPCLS